MPAIVAAHPLERLARSRVRIREDRRRQRSCHVIDRQQVRAVTGERVTFRLNDGLHFVGVALGKAGVDKRDDRNIQTVEPDYGHIARIAVIVKRP